MPESKHTESSNGRKSPRWNLLSIFPGFDSLEYQNAKKRLSIVASEFLAHLAALSGIGNGNALGIMDSQRTSSADFELWLIKALDMQNLADVYSRTLSSYCYAAYSTNTSDNRAMNELNAIEEIQLPFARADVLFLNALAANFQTVQEIMNKNTFVGRYSFFLNDALFRQKRQMSAAEEALAADLARSGADAWGRLQEQLTSTADCVWDEKSGMRKTLVELRALAYNPDRTIREKAYVKELEACKNISIPIAAALNGIKGTSISLNRRRHWVGGKKREKDSSKTNNSKQPNVFIPFSYDDDFYCDPNSSDTGTYGALEKSVRQSRITRETLDALITVLEESLPHWQRYLRAKARLLGIPACAFYDLFAPVGSNFPVYSWEEVRSTVISNFASFSSAMGNFATRAFDSGWIDAEPRKGKVSGAYCIDMPLVKETRVLCNFDGSFNTVITVAHELGHAFHFDVVKNLPGLQQNYPMTLAETASIFAETVVFHAELAKAVPEARLGLLEAHLQDGCQIMTDILSRFYFEKSVFADRIRGELSPDDFCAKMIDAQKRTYGDGLDPEKLHPYMWLIKCHYYSSDLAFYNFPYAFGQLFAMALYARYRDEGPAFAKTYEQILLETGRMDAIELTAKAGCDIEDSEFWRSGLAVFVSQIDEFEKLVATQTPGTTNSRQ